MGAGLFYVLAYACLALLVLGYVVVGALWLLPRTRAAAAEVFPVLHMEALIVGVVAGSFLLGGWVLIAFLTLHALRTAYEAAAITLPRAGIFGRNRPVAVAVMVTLTGALAHFLPPILLCLFAIAGLAAAFALWKLQIGGPRLRIAVELALFPYIPLILFTALAFQGHAISLLIAFLLVETFDSYALLGGKLFGRTRAFPILSPRKTVEGLVVGAAMLALTAAAVGWLIAGLPVTTSVGVALIAGALTIAGDLSASRLKRAAGVKDFPRVLPHQGGLLDITDAWIAAGAGLAALMVLT